MMISQIRKAILCYSRIFNVAPRELFVQSATESPIQSVELGTPLLFLGLGQAITPMPPPTCRHRSDRYADEQ
jgi:hypothetical protein